MTLRLSGGELRSRRIPAPRGLSVRPTPGRVKEALFSIIGGRIAGARVLDLFAGTGAIGFEAISRGAAQTTFVERHPPTAAAIRATAAALGITDRVQVLCGAAERVAQRLEGRYDFVYADPPFALPPPAAALAALRDGGALDARTIVVYERRADAPQAAFAGFTTEREARYGEVALQFLRVDA
ncbi:MAG TPA: 16S rRNA (guanine(966)-N(2))-methyltransferase RsmD [Candidatus Acidoferrales bacterium]|nr:16S rRNA (guanine(966)-N(2))-methyltransferase RsmD [Candidatus Acidoferrales bacterium]